jgi:hypothetical protein
MNDDAEDANTTGAFQKYVCELPRAAFQLLLDRC